MNRTVMFVGGGLEAVPAVLRARALGLKVVVSDRAPDAPCFRHADYCLLASTYDAAATVAAAEAFHRDTQRIDGVLCVAHDVPVTVAAVAQALGLPGNSLQTAHLATDKLAMKQRFAADGLPIPWFQAVDSGNGLARIVRERGGPLVVKPVDSRGARGVLRLTAEVDPVWAFGFAQAESPTGRVMVEAYLPGPQVSTESLVLDGVAHTVGFSDRNYEFLEHFSPHIIENGGDLPSVLPASVQGEIRELVQAAALSMGVRNGVVKGDIVVTDGKPYVIELAARLSGGYFCTHEIPLNTGVDFVGAAIRLVLGDTVEPDELTPRFQQAVSQRYIFPAPGVVAAVDGADDVSMRAGIELCEVRVTVGQSIGPMHSHPARAGVVIATGASPQEARARAQQAVTDIRITTCA